MGPRGCGNKLLAPAGNAVIWFQHFTLEDLARSRADTMVDHIGIEFTVIGDDFLKAVMPIDQRTRQPMGIMHGGASCALAETVASVAANCCVDPAKKVCGGLEINTSHIKTVRSGLVTATARAVHLGRSTQLWEISTVDDKGTLVAMSRLRLAVIDKTP